MTGQASPIAAHLSALDGLRGFAALLVVVSHCANRGFLPDFLGYGLGQMGVTLFFGLSGFLMAYLYYDKTPTLENIRDYTINRIARVLPLFYIVAIFVTVCFAAFDYSFLKVTSWKQVAGNLFLLRGSSVLWTIPVELHFYVVFVGLWFISGSRLLQACGRGRRSSAGDPDRTVCERDILRPDPVFVAARLPFRKPDRRILRSDQTQAPNNPICGASFRVRLADLAAGDFRPAPTAP